MTEVCVCVYIHIYENVFQVYVLHIQMCKPSTCI